MAVPTGEVPPDATPTAAAAATSGTTGAWPITTLRKMAAAATAGMAVGFIVGGWGSRLAMMLLARLNPQVTGLVSDDDFIMGRFTLGNTIGLVFVGTLFGMFGGLLYQAIRPLRFGPSWFQTAALVVGPAVVIGGMLVHTDGRDFTLLQPAELAIALFVALSGLAAFGVVRLTDHLTREEGWFMTTRLVHLSPWLLLGALGFPALALAVGMGLAWADDAAGQDDQRLAEGVLWAARAGLVVLFVVESVGLLREIGTLV